MHYNTTSLVDRYLLINFNTFIEKIVNLLIEINQVYLVEVTPKKMKRFSETKHCLWPLIQLLCKTESNFNQILI